MFDDNIGQVGDFPGQQQPPQGMGMGMPSNEIMQQQQRLMTERAFTEMRLGKLSTLGLAVQAIGAIDDEASSKERTIVLKKLYKAIGQLAAETSSS